MTESAHVDHVADAARYEISVNGQLAGLTAYIDHGDQRIFYHTETNEEFAGEGLASQLVSAALADARQTGKRVVPVCPFVAKYVKTHHDFDDILDPVTPEAIDTVRAQASRESTSGVVE